MVFVGCVLGYDGVLDCIPVSELFRVYYEVMNCIFMLGNFESLNRVKEEV